jgi:hypothetical protein
MMLVQVPGRIHLIQLLIHDFFGRVDSRAMLLHDPLANGEDSPYSSLRLFMASAIKYTRMFDVWGKRMKGYFFYF